MITPPSEVYKFWRVSPLDFFVFFIGVFVTIFVGIQEGIFATIILSILVLISGIFNAEGKFLGSVLTQRIPGGNDLDKAESLESADSKRVFLPLDRGDGSNPLVHLERPLPGIFIFRFTEGFNYTNASNQLERMIESIYEQTKPSTKGVDKNGVS